MEELDLLDLFYPDEQGILAQVDEYYLYSAYLGFEPWPGKPYHSMVRPIDDRDNVASWALYELSNPRGNIGFVWKDFATGQRGDIYDLVACMMSMQGTKAKRRDAIAKVREDIRNMVFTVPARGEVPRPEGFGQPKDIRVKSRPSLKEQELLYWLEIGVNTRQLNKYNTTAISHSWVDDKIRYHGLHSYAYRIGSKYQIYMPFAEKKNKFRNNYSEKEVPGYLQLPRSGPVCIIGKANKELIAQDAWGFPSVAPRGENIPLPSWLIPELKQRFKRVVSLFDNDGKHQLIDDVEELHVPISSGTKDPTDFARVYGVPMTIEMINDLLWT
jgi:hypothetical protein